MLQLSILVHIFPTKSLLTFSSCVLLFSVETLKQIIFLTSFDLLIEIGRKEQNNSWEFLFHYFLLFSSVLFIFLTKTNFATAFRRLLLTQLAYDVYNFRL